MASQQLAPRAGPARRARAHLITSGSTGFSPGSREIHTIRRHRLRHGSLRERRPFAPTASDRSAHDARHGEFGRLGPASDGVPRVARAVRADVAVADGTRPALGPHRGRRARRGGAVDGGRGRGSGSRRSWRRSGFRRGRDRQRRGRRRAERAERGRDRRRPGGFRRLDRDDRERPTRTVRGRAHRRRYGRRARRRLHRHQRPRGRWRERRRSDGPRYGCDDHGHDRRHRPRERHRGAARRRPVGRSCRRHSVHPIGPPSEIRSSPSATHSRSKVA